MARIFDTATITPETRFSPDEQSHIYNFLDCALTAEIFEAIRADADNQTMEIYEGISKPLQGPILDMNMTGILVDQHQLQKMLIVIERDIARFEAMLSQLLTEGYGFDDINYKSSQQLQAFLYDYLRIKPIRKRNAKGGFSPTTDRQALERIRDNYFIAKPFVQLLLELRDLVKQQQFLETSIDADSRMRCAYNIAGTNTGRLSSALSDFGTGTNLQNVSRRLRRIFVAPKGKKLLNVDLEQADSRNVGATCWNRFVRTHGEAFAGAYLDACESGDLHTQVTRMARPELAWPDDPSEWRAFADAPLDWLREKSYRDLSKGLGHGSNYLLTPASAVVKIPGLDIQQAIAFKNKYFTAFPCIPEWHKAVQENLLDTASITTIWGRRRYFFGRPDESSTHRAAVAYEGQSATADEINKGMLALWLKGKRWPGFQLIGQVHDSLLIEYDEECEDEFVPWALEQLRVPLILEQDREFVVPTEAKIGWNWADASESNPDGLKKWKGTDQRVRTEEPRTSFSLR